ncbi:nucleotide exchange factor GrpE [Paenibacillus sp. GYB004]|uniref:nucleotide exchange factor GrpE n=1 Tax=Paenibacillus sp. GYB004 TaxID=2994393 RepID=UPI002F969479
MTEQEKQATLDQEELVTETAAETGQEETGTAGASAEAGAEDGVKELSEAERQLEEQRKLADEHYQRYLRTQADFDNFRRRSRQEKEDFAKYASVKLIEQLIPVIDNFERAITASKDNTDHEALLKGVDMIYRQLDQVLVQEGLQRIEAVGRPFNPEFHQAVMQVESEEHEEGTVVEELQTGYMLKDKVIRPSMVKVSG